jgi:biopolymer transport protein TolR
MQHLNKRVTKKQMAEINVVPYIDVMLVLLVIFMVTAPLLTEAYKVELPEASAKPVKKSKQPPVIVSVDRKGRLYVNLGDNPKKSITAKKLVARVLARRKQHPEIPILIQGDVRADYGKVINAMSILNEAGIDNFSLVTKPAKR